MIMTVKRKFTSGVAVLCALMILIGIVPMNIFGGNNTVEAATTTGDNSQDIPTEGDTKPAHDPNKLYMKSTFYDYYSDYELGGKVRSDLKHQTDSQFNDINGYGWTNTRYIQAQKLDKALSDYYSKNNIANPLYFGHFQWKSNTEGTYFTVINKTLNLYGASTTGDNLTYSNREFFHNNNSEYRKDCIIKDGCVDANQNHTHPTNVAVQGLFYNKLVNDNIMIKNKSGNPVAAPYFNKEYLRGSNSANTAFGNVYENVDFPFVKNKDGYWEFNSADASQTVRLKQTTKGEYYLDEIGASGAMYGYTDGAIINVPNFFPLNSRSDFTELNNIEQSFNSSTLVKKVNDVNNPAGDKIDVKAISNGTYVDRVNYGFGMTLDIPFNINDEATDENGNPIKFNFSGDDDVLIYLDGKLVLDLGGSHGAVGGEIDFKNKQTTVTAVKTTTAETKNVVKTFSELGIDDFQSGNHEVKIFYMERGIWESNMKITFNMTPETQLDVEKEVDITNINEAIKSAISDNVNSLEFGFDISSASKAEKIENYTLNDCSTLSTVSYYPTGANNEYISDFNGRKNSIKIVLNNLGGAAHNYGPTFTFNKNNPVDLEKIDYLYFWVYNDSTTATGNPRITLFDSNGRALFNGGYNGFSDSESIGWLNSLRYDDTHYTLGSKGWNQIRISAKKIVDNIKNKENAYNPDFNYNAVSKLTITSYESTTMYISDIGYYRQDNSVTTWKPIAPAANAEYTLGNNTTTYHADENGAFTLKDNPSDNSQLSHFVNQFNIGDALKVHEQDTYKFNNQSHKLSDLFSTEWELYKGGNLKSSSKSDATKNKYYADDGSTSEDNAFSFSGTVDIPDRVKFINTVKTGSLKITKNLVDANGNTLNAPNDLTFNFTVTLSNVGGIKLEGNNSITENVTVTVPRDSSSANVSITGIPVGTEFNITEKSTTGYTPSYSSQSGTITNADTDTTVTVTNAKNRERGGLSLIKKLYDIDGNYISDRSEYSNKEFKFKVTLTSTDFKIADYIADIGNTNSVQYRSNWKSENDGKKISATISIAASSDNNRLNNIPYGTSYSLEEIPDSDSDYEYWSEESSNMTGTIGSSGSSVTVTIANKAVPKKATLTIKKYDSNDANKETGLQGAVFALYDAETGGNQVREQQTTDAYGTATFTDLEPDTTYWIEEVTPPSGYQSKAERIEVTTGAAGSTTNKDIFNDPIILPEAGGPGSDNNPFNFVLFGIGAIALAGIAFILLNKKYNLRGRISSSAKEVR